MADKPDERQQAFIAALFDEENNPTFCPKVAKEMAGYPANSPVKQIMDGVQRHIVEYAEPELAALLPKAIGAITKSLKTPTRNSAIELAAAKEIMDRAGLTKKSSMALEVEAPNGLFILPPKDDV